MKAPGLRTVGFRIYTISMPVFDSSDDLPFPVWTKHDVDLLEAIDPDYCWGLTNIVEYLTRHNGILDSHNFDLILLMHAVVNSGVREDIYSMQGTEAIVSVASEFCLIDCLYDKQSLEALELQDNGVLYMAVHESSSSALDAAICLSDRESSVFRNRVVRPCLALFGAWEDFAGTILETLLTLGELSTKIGFLIEYLKAAELIPSDDMMAMGMLLKLSDVGLFDVHLDDDLDGVISTNVQAAGIFLLFSDREDLARRLAAMTE